MTPIEISSGLKSIRLLDAVSCWDDKRIAATRQFKGEARFAALEACAQLCALHVRQMEAFRRHAFLLAINAVAPLPPDYIHGPAILEARLKGAGPQAFSYEVCIQFEKFPPIDVSLLVGTAAYGRQFPEEKLKPYYQRLFADLTGRKVPLTNRKGAPSSC